MITSAKARLTVMIFFGAMLAAVPALADFTTEWVFVAGMDGTEEVPPNDQPQSGHATLFLNEDQNQVSYFIEYDPIPNETGAHFHLGAFGENGPVIEPLPAGNPKIGVWNISPEHVQALFDGMVYVNIHSEEYPGGHIRGQIEFCAVPAETATWSQIKTLFE